MKYIGKTAYYVIIISLLTAYTYMGMDENHYGLPSIH